MTGARRQPSYPETEVGGALQWAARGAWLTSCGAPLAVGIASGWGAGRAALYVALALIGLLLTEGHRLPQPWCWAVMHPLWRYLLLFGVLGAAMLAVGGDPFIQPALLCVPFVHAALAYPGRRAAAIGALYVGLIPLGLRLSGQAEPIALTYPTLAYAALLMLIDAFVRVSLAQAQARARTAELARELARERDELARLAAENARLAQQAAEAATLAERNRLARELHDTIAQGLTATTMQIEAAQRALERDPARARARLTRAHELSRAALDDVRRSVWTLAEPLVADAGLPKALEALARRFAERTGVPATFCHEGPPPDIGAASATQLLRVAQEALQNVEKHAGASRVGVALLVDERAVRLRVSDDGRGFEPDEGVGDGFGLVSLRERARLAGGELDIASAPGAGARVTMTVARPGAPTDGGGG